MSFDRRSLLKTLAVGGVAATAGAVPATARERPVAPPAATGTASASGGSGKRRKRDAQGGGT